MAKREITLRVNGESHRLWLDEHRLLLDVLREDLGLTGSKRGCETGECGCCNVWLDGRAVRGCLQLAARLEGRVITTIEGLAPRAGEALHPVQRAFVEEGAFQCGYCTPGMVMLAAGLLEEHREPGDDEIRRTLASNLCRCTGYKSIEAAVRRAAVRVAEAPPAEELGGTVVGQPLPQIHAVEKVTGRLAYAGDVTRPGLLAGKILRSPYPHARVLGIDTAQARALAGVRAVITGADLPDKRFGRTFRDDPILAKDKVTFVGEGVAAVAAIDEETAAAALALIEVDYEVLPAVFDAPDALAPDAPRVHEHPESYEFGAHLWGMRWLQAKTGRTQVLEGNVCNHFRLRGGDVARGFAEADVVVEGRYHHPMANHAPMETHAALAEADRSGRITVWTGSQAPYPLRDALAEYFGLPASRIRVLGMKVGGGWGAKLDPTLEPVCIALSRAAGRPVRIVLTRTEQFVAIGGRRPGWIRVKTGASRDGTLVAREVEEIWSAGYRGGGVGASAVLPGYTGTGPYRVRNVKTDSLLVYSHVVAPRAFRGLFCPQLYWAIEQHTDDVAARLGIDPVEFRRRNAFVTGDRTAWGEVLEDVDALRCLEAVTAAIDWGAPKRPWRGRGVALGWKWTAAGTLSRAQVWVHADGSVTVATGVPDLGQGIDTSLAQVAAAEVGVSRERVEVVCVDTDYPSYDVGAFSSRAAIHAGRAVHAAAVQARERVLALAAETLGAPASDLAIEDGRVVSRRRGANRIPLGEVLAGRGSILGEGEMRGADASGFDPETGATDRVCAEWKYCATGVDLEVDPETGIVVVHKVASAHDAGRALNRQIVEQQIVGGLVQAFGSTFLEHTVFDNGRIVNPTFMDYLLPTADAVPAEIVPIVFESGTGLGPYGAKGVGELSLVALPAAAGNALYDATGVRLHELPITPEKVLAGLRGRDDGASRGPTGS